jgi:hypothetical protein
VLIAHVDRAVRKAAKALDDSFCSPFGVRYPTFFEVHDKPVSERIDTTSEFTRAGKAWDTSAFEAAHSNIFRVSRYVQLSLE